MAQKNKCLLKVTNPEIREFIEAQLAENPNLIEADLLKLFQRRNAEQREKILINRKAELDLQANREASIEWLKKNKVKRNQVRTSKSETLLLVKQLTDKSDIGLFRNQIVQSKENYAGSANNYETNLRERVSKYEGELKAGLIEIKTEDGKNFFNNRDQLMDISTEKGRKLSDDIRREIGLLNGNETVKSTGNKEAKQLAKQLQKVLSQQIKDQQALGIKTGLRKGYAGLQTHDVNKLSLSGFENWKNKIIPLLNQNQAKAFTDSPEGLKALRAVYDNLANRDVLDLDLSIIPISKKELVSNFKNERALNFKSVDDEIQYNKIFGIDEDIVESSFRAIKRNAKAMADFQMFGFVDPKIAIKKQLRNIFENDLSQAERAKIIQNGGLEQYERLIIADYESLTGQRPLARATNTVRAVESAITLTGTVMNQAGNDILVKRFRNLLRTGEWLELAKVPLIPFESIARIGSNFAKIGKIKKSGLTDAEQIVLANNGFLSEGIHRTFQNFVIENIQEVKPEKGNWVGTWTDWVHKLALNQIDTQAKEQSYFHSLTREAETLIPKLGTKEENKFYKSFLERAFNPEELKALKGLTPVQKGEGIHGSDFIALDKEYLEPLIAKNKELLIEKQKMEYASKKAELQTLNIQLKEAEALKTGVVAEGRQEINKKIDELKSQLSTLQEKFINSKKEFVEGKIQSEDILLAEKIDIIKKARDEINRNIDDLESEKTRKLQQFQEQQNARKRTRKTYFTEFQKRTLKSLDDKIKFEKRRLKNEELPFLDKEDYSKIKKLESQQKRNQANFDKLEEGKVYFTLYERRRIKDLKDKIKLEERRLKNDDLPFLDKEDYVILQEANRNIEKYTKAMLQIEKEALQFERAIKEKFANTPELENIYTTKRLELENKYRSLLREETQAFFNQGGQKIKSVATSGVLGKDLGAIFSQLKISSASTYFDTYYAFMGNPHFQGLGKWGVLSAFLGFSIYTGMQAEIMSDAVSNYGEPKKYKTEAEMRKLLIKSFQRGGAGGILFDLGNALFGNALGSSRQPELCLFGDVASFVGGPTGGTVSSLLTGLNQAIGEQHKIDTLTRTIIKGIPGANVFYWRALTNHAVFGIAEFLDEQSNGYLKSTARKNKQKKEREEEGLFSGEKRKTLGDLF